MKQKTISTGILSYGLSGSVFHAPFVDKHEGFELDAVVERTKKRAQETYPDIKSYASVVALLEDPAIELVIVNTPNATHYEYAKQALEAGKHVLMEKPFTVSVNEAITLFDLAQEKQLHLLAYQNRRYDSDFLSVKEIITSGKLGDLVEVHFRFDRYRYEIGSKAVKEKKNIAGSGLLYDLGPHIIDGAISLFGQPQTWSKQLGKFRPNTEVDDYAQIQLSYPNGMQVYLTMSMLVADPQPAFVLHGTTGSFIKHRSDVQETQLRTGISINDALFGIEDKSQQGILTTIINGKKSVEKIQAKRGSYLSVFDDVYATIRTQKPCPVTKEEIIKQLEIITS